jgi:hypothetical protein
MPSDLEGFDMGRKALFGKPMTQSQRNKRHIDKLKKLATIALKSDLHRSEAGPSGKQVSAHDVDPRQIDIEDLIAYKG